MLGLVSDKSIPRRTYKSKIKKFYIDNLRILRIYYPYLRNSNSFNGCT